MDNSRSNLYVRVMFHLIFAFRREHLRPGVHLMKTWWNVVITKIPHPVIKSGTEWKAKKFWTYTFGLFAYIINQWSLYILKTRMLFQHKKFLCIPFTIGTRSSRIYNSLVCTLTHRTVRPTYPSCLCYWFRSLLSGRIKQMLMSENTAYLSILLCIYLGAF